MIEVVDTFWSDMFTLLVMVWWVFLITWIWLWIYSSEDPVWVPESKGVKRLRLWSGLLMVLTFIAWFTLQESGLVEEEELRMEEKKLPSYTHDFNS